ncbi:MAG: hypothetical protein JWM46_458 [Candidatus Kaiserbacteria bacterium]|nr:hypothetical protein [Candidatus Kaiserbacteria bacterium]
MLQLSADANVIVYFEGLVKCFSPAIRQIVLEDVTNLLEGKRGEFLEHRPDIAEHFLDVCHDFGAHLSCPMKIKA